MKNTFGSSLTVSLFGESHGEAIGAVLDGLAPGISIDHEYIAHKLDMRRPHGAISTARVERDEYKIVSGAFEGYTTGTPLTLLIPNENTVSKDYSALKRTPRPSHADYTASIKYHGFQDYRGGGHFSGRVTAPIVAAGAIVQSALMKKGIYIGTHIHTLAGIKDRDFIDYYDDIKQLDTKEFPTLDSVAKEKMTSLIEEAKKDGDSVGGILETAVIGLSAGVGEPWFDTVESQLAHGIFSIPAIKGVEFGRGFGVATLRGSDNNDPLCAVDGEVRTVSNNDGGINGGITNGMPIVMRCAVKPTPSIAKEQRTVDLDSVTDTTLAVSGRHDPCVIHRARAVVDAMTALVIADLLTVRFGTDFLA